MPQGKQKSKTGKLGRKYRWKIRIIKKAWVQGFIFHHSHVTMNNEDLIPSYFLYLIVFTIKQVFAFFPKGKDFNNSS